MPAAAARSVLQNSSLRWSSPILFNDPFDVPRELAFNLSPKSIVRAIAHRMASLIECPPEDTSDLEPKIRLIIETMKHGITDDQRTEILARLADSGEIHHPTETSMKAFREMWRRSLTDFRILCLTESPAHAAMWYHYADRYKGVVIEFRCDDRLDSAWLAAKPVSYLSTKPTVYTADGWAELLTTEKEIALNRLLHTTTYTKSLDWSYENEWRITSFRRPSDTGLFTDYQFDPREVAAIYFGPYISTSDRIAISTLANQYPAIRLIDVFIGMDREFNFAPIGY